MFWDSVHPTTRTHEMLANFIVRQLQVPEPAALGLFIVGLLCVAIARWRRHS
jgi:phospholipase/lecithinase/hemolysin